MHPIAYDTLRMFHRLNSKFSVTLQRCAGRRTVLELSLTSLKILSSENGTFSVSRGLVQNFFCRNESPFAGLTLRSYVSLEHADLEDSDISVGDGKLFMLQRSQENKDDIF